jgi:hypothetical protein
MTGTKFYMDPPIFSPNRNYDRGYMSHSKHHDSAMMVTLHPTPTKDIKIDTR